jgi:L-fuculose-phosphate aldolase
MPPDTAEEGALREALAQQYRYVAVLGLNALASGNVSCRLGADAMLISAGGATPETIAPDTVVRTTLDGTWEGDRQPSSEWRMHAAIYRQHPTAGAVVHTHSDYCVAVASHNQPLPGFHYLVGTFGGNDVPCVPYATFGTEQLASSASNALTDRTACLLGNHGMICRGGDLASAVELAHRLEIMCRQYVLARHLGEPDVLDDAQWQEFFARAGQAGYL